MLCTDSSFLIDYLTEADDGPAAAFLEAHDDEPFYAPTIALFEIYCGPADGAGVTVERIAGLVDWLEPLPFTEASAREAAYIRRELRETYHSLGTADVLIAADTRRDARDRRCGFHGGFRSLGSDVRMTNTEFDSCRPAGYPFQRGCCDVHRSRWTLTGSVVRGKRLCCCKSTSEI